MLVYLSKSNYANPDDVSTVRKYIKDCGFKGIEFMGGQYSSQKMLDCQIIVMVTANGHINNDWTVGKGLYQQHGEAFKRGIPVFGVSKIYKDYIDVTPILHSEVTNGERSWNNYGVFHRDNITYTLEAVLNRCKDDLDRKGLNVDITTGELLNDVWGDGKMVKRGHKTIAYDLESTVSRRWASKNYPNYQQIPKDRVDNITEGMVIKYPLTPQECGDIPMLVIAKYLKLI